MRRVLHLFLLLAMCLVSLKGASELEAYFRMNQLGYHTDGLKTAVLFSKQDLSGRTVEIKTKKLFQKTVLRRQITDNEGAFGQFPFHYRIDFTTLQEPGEYWFELAGTDIRSHTFPVKESGTYSEAREKMLGYIQQQRCGYNPFLDETCHTKDGRTVYGPMPDGTFVYVFGGWHDAADLLQYMMTSGNTIGRLLLAYSET
ncbi:TPA: glycoside hydrolase family 9, partial [Candidatus Marinimicrobia bacterium]|nr:glycoside hydrolase family 9 [Candidatus Neomarinimicrobiota bacterium]HBY17633.1 glycoside hydrolase family 9 [Candidatus Neomarinimicrobiota bacterium]